METHEDRLYFAAEDSDEGKRELYYLDLSKAQALASGNKNLSIVSIQNGVSDELKYAEKVFLNDNPDVQVSYKVLDLTYPDAKVKILSGDLDMDIAVINTSLIYDLAASGALVDLSHFDDINSIMTGEDILDGLYEYSSVDGFLFGVPFSYWADVLKVNTYLREKLNLNLPDANWTWQDFYDYAKQARKDLDGNGSKDSYIMGARKNSPLFLEAYLCKFVNQVTGKVDFNNDIFINLLNLWKKMCDEDLIKTISDPPYIKDDTVLFTLDTAGYHMGNDEYVCIPALSNNLKVYPCQGSFLCISSLSKNPNLAAKFIVTYLSKEVQATHTYKIGELFVKSLPMNYLYKDLSIYDIDIDSLNEKNKEIIINVAKYVTPKSYPFNLKTYITQEVMPQFMSGKITAPEAAALIQKKAEMMIKE